MGVPAASSPHVHPGIFLHVAAFFTQREIDVHSAFVRVDVVATGIDIGVVAAEAAAIKLTFDLDRAEGFGAPATGAPLPLNSAY